MLSAVCKHSLSLSWTSPSSSFKYQIWVRHFILSVYRFWEDCSALFGRLVCREIWLARTRRKGVEGIGRGKAERDRNNLASGTDCWDEHSCKIKKTSIQVFAVIVLCVRVCVYVCVCGCVCACIHIYQSITHPTQTLIVTPRVSLESPFNPLPLFLECGRKFLFSQHALSGHSNNFALLHLNNWKGKDKKVQRKIM